MVRRSISRRRLVRLLDEWERTGYLWEQYDPASGGIHEICGWPYPLFRSSFLLCLCGLLYGGTLFAWRRCKVDYRTALDVSPFVTYDTVLAYAYACFIAVFSAFLVYALLLMAPGALGADVSAFRDALPALAFLAPALFLAWRMLL